MAQRGSVTRFVERHSVAWEIVMAVLTVVYVLIAVGSDTHPGMTGEPHRYAGEHALNATDPRGFTGGGYVHRPPRARLRLHGSDSLGIEVVGPPPM